MLWKYGIAWGCSWFALLAVALVTTSISTKGNRTVIDWNVGKAVRLFLLIGIATGAIVAVIYQHAEKQAVHGGKSLLEGAALAQEDHYVLDGSPDGSVVYVAGTCPDTFVQPSTADTCNDATGKTVSPLSDPSKATGCLRNTNGAIVLNRHDDPTVKCTKDAPCVCVDQYAECKQGTCHVPWRLPTWAIVTILVLVVLLLVAFRRQLVLGARLLGLAIAGKA